MSASYDVRIWKTEVYKGQRTTTHRVRWSVAGRPFKEPFKTAALADSFRSALVSAARKGEPFDTETGRPDSMQQTDREMAWYAFACKYVDQKWPTAAATTRRTNAEALTKVTVAMLKDTRGRPDDQLLRTALTRWGFNTNRRESPECPVEIRRALKWVEANSRNVSSLTSPETLRMVLDTIGLRLDGKPGAPSVVSRHRKIFSATVWYAVELKLLPDNPIRALKWKPRKPSLAIDKRSVANPVQVRTLLDAVREGSSGDRLVAFFACIYFAGLRPEEAVGLGKHNLALPKTGWGELLLDGAEPYAGSDWTDDGGNRDRRRQLKQREVGEGRTAPCPPELTAYLQQHIERFGFGPDGRLFVGERNKSELPKGTINRAWREARRAVFTPEVYASPLAATPYDLRHACISFWILAGVDPATAAKWAGQSIEILFRTYAAWLSGQEKALRRNIEDAYGSADHE